MSDLENRSSVVGSETAQSWRGRRAVFLDCPIDLLSLEETIEVAVTAMRERRSLLHVVVNVAKLVALRDDEELRRDVSQADIINIDGMGVVWGARLLGLPVPERVTGIDLMDRLLERCAREGFRPYFLGARPAVLERAVAELKRRHPGLDVAGRHDGYFGKAGETTVVEAIRASGADCLFVGMPSPAKERFNRAHARELGVPFVMGVGGSFDVFAGTVQRAPRWVQRAGLEWLYRLCQEPRRLWKRYLVSNATYAALLVRELIRRRRR